MENTKAARPSRDLAVDFYRVSGVVLIVLGHWLAGSVTYHDGHFGRQNPLVDLPWTQWLTWPFQAVPVFFLVAGYAGAISWARRYTGDAESRQDWVRRRLARVLGPTAVYVGLMSVTVVILDVSGLPGSVLEYAGWAVAMHLWFLAVYVVVVSLTPIAIAAQRRWGLVVPAVLALGVVVVDVVSRAGHIPYLGWSNYVLCWGLLYQLGIAWHGGSLAGRKPVVLAAGSAVTLALLIWVGPYPASMIGVPGQTVQNTTPPSMALAAFGCTQAGLAVALAPALNRALRFGVVQRVLSTTNSNVMALYLWHLVPVVIVAILGYPTGLLPQPVEGTAQWWLARGVGSHPQPRHGGRTGVAVVASALFRGAAAYGRSAARISLDRTGDAGRCRNDDVWSGILGRLWLCTRRTFTLGDHANFRPRAGAAGLSPERMSLGTQRLS